MYVLDPHSLKLTEEVTEQNKLWELFCRPTFYPTVVLHFINNEAFKGPAEPLRLLSVTSPETCSFRANSTSLTRYEPSLTHSVWFTATPFGFYSQNEWKGVVKNQGFTVREVVLVMVNIMEMIEFKSKAFNTLSHVNDTHLVHTLTFTFLFRAVLLGIGLCFSLFSFHFCEL